MGHLAAPRYKGMLHALQTIVATDGLIGLWRGALPAVQRAALVNLGELAAYDSVSLLLLNLLIFICNFDVKQMFVGQTGGAIIRMAARWISGACCIFMRLGSGCNDRFDSGRQELSVICFTPSSK